MKFWNRSGDAFELNGWRVQKDWASGLWDIYRDGAVVGANWDSADEAIKEAERMMER